MKWIEIIQNPYCQWFWLLDHVKSSNSLKVGMCQAQDGSMSLDEAREEFLRQWDLEPSTREWDVLELLQHGIALPTLIIISHPLIIHQSSNNHH